MQSRIQSKLIAHILLGVDGSVPSARAREYALCLALNQSARVTVIHAFSPVSAFLDNEYRAQKKNSRYDEAQALVFDTVERLRDAGVDQVEPIVREGAPVNIILDTAAQYEVDVIVIGSRGTSEWNGAIQGSVSAAVTQRATCSVLVVK